MQPFPTLVHTALHKCSVTGHSGSCSPARRFQNWCLSCYEDDYGRKSCHVMKMTMAESHSDLGCLSRHTFCFSPSVLARDSKMPVMTVAIASNQGLQCDDKEKVIMLI